MYMFLVDVDFSFLGINAHKFADFMGNACMVLINFFIDTVYM